MTSRLVIGIETDDKEFEAQIQAGITDEVSKWRFYHHVTGMMLEKALKAEAVREHYDTIHMRARLTRAANKARQENP